MSNEPPTLSTYEDMADVTFDLSDTDISEGAVNAELESLFEN